MDYSISKKFVLLKSICTHIEQSTCTTVTFRKWQGNRYIYKSTLKKIQLKATENFKKLCCDRNIQCEYIYRSTLKKIQLKATENFKKLSCDRNIQCDRYIQGRYIYRFDCNYI